MKLENIFKKLNHKTKQIDENLLKEAIKRTDAKTLKFLLKCGEYDVNSMSDGQPLFFLPAKTRDASSVIMLLKMGADITKKNKDGQDIFEFINTMKNLSDRGKENLIKEIKKAVAKISKKLTNNSQVKFE